MPIIRKLDKTEFDIAHQRNIILEMAEATHHAASVHAEAAVRYYALPTDRLLDALNHDVEASVATAQVSRTLALAINAALDALDLPQFPKRAPTESPRPDIVFDGTRFVQVLPEPTPEPEPEPAPEQPE